MTLPSDASTLTSQDYSATDQQARKRLEKSSMHSSDFTHEFGLISFIAGSRNNENCGANGLPITPSSITIIGNHKALVENVIHANLVQYVDCFRTKHEKISLIFEHYTGHISEKHFTQENILPLVIDLLNGLHYLHSVLHMTHGNIDPSCVVCNCRDNSFKWSHWAINTITENGSLLDLDAVFPSDIRFLSPERISHSSRSAPKKCDIWSFGLVILSLLFPQVKLPENPADLARLDSSKAVLRRLEIPTHELEEKWLNFFEFALEPSIKARYSSEKLLNFLQVPICKPNYHLIDSFLDITKVTVDTSNESQKVISLTVSESYYLLTVASPGFKESPDRTTSQSIPPIHTIPLLVTVSPILLSQSSSVISTPPSPEQYTRFVNIPSSVKTVNTQVLKKRLAELNEELFYPLILYPTEEEKRHLASMETMNLPLVIRETDFAYQVERVLLFKALLDGIPYSLPNLLETAKMDINPFYRARTWAAILDIRWSDLQLYERINKTTNTSTERQISVDIPRCHQYNDLLASPQGHLKLTKILKAWLKHNEPQGFVYWQGLDSLAAPFVILNFSNEPLAFACFDAFINKYLRGFFAKDNSPTIQEYLALFSHLIAFHDADLFNHLDQLGFTPELYAIPWFLTMFTHVLPLHKTIHLWDTLLFGNESFPLCIGLAILLQLRSQILSYTFNDCILIFSDLPEINMDTCVKDATALFKQTPKSSVLRGWVPLDELRSQLCPQIEINDLASMVKSPSNGKIVIIDMRTEEELASFGPISSAIVCPECLDASQVKELIPASYSLLVIVNNLPVANELVRSGMAKVCLLVASDFIPTDLAAC